MIETRRLEELRLIPRVGDDVRAIEYARRFLNTYLEFSRDYGGLRLGVRFGAVLSKRAMNCTPKFRQGHRFFQSRVKTSQYRLAGASVLIPVHPLVEK